MRVLLVTHRYPPYGSAGVERVSEQTAVGLAAAGHEVMVFTRESAATPALPILVRARRNAIDVLTVKGGGTSLENFPGRAREIERLFERTVLEFEPSGVLISHLIDHSPTYVSLAHRWKVPAVVEMHDFYLACERAHLERHSGGLCAGPEGGRACAAYCFPNDPMAAQRWPLRTHMFRHAVEQADALICPSQFVSDTARQLFGSSLPPVFVIGNGVTFSMSRPVVNRPRDEDVLRLACVGAIVPHKGLHVVIEALRLARVPRVELTLFGLVTHPYLGRLLTEATAVPNLTVRVFGTFEPEQLPALLPDTDLVIVPSLVAESYGLGAREALACGVPVAASRIGALPEGIRHRENGLLFTPGSALELAAILQQVAEDPTLLPQLRAGILPSDWISVSERVAAVEDVMANEVNAAVSPEEDPSASELRLLRDQYAVR